MRPLLILILCIIAPTAFAQSTDDIDAAYKTCRGHYTNHAVTEPGGKTVMVLGYEPGWEKCGDIEQAYYNEAQKNKKITDDDKKLVHDLAKKLFPPTPNRGQP